MVRGRRRATEKVPKPTRVTGSPRRSAARTAMSIVRSARSLAARGQPEACAMRATRSARVTLHPEDDPGLVHHRLGDGRVALALGEALDRAARHRANEGGNALQPRLGLHRPREVAGLGWSGRRCRREPRRRDNRGPPPPTCRPRPRTRRDALRPSSSARFSNGSGGTVRPPTFTPRLRTICVSNGLVSMATLKPHSGQRKVTAREPSSGPSVECSFIG